MVSPLSDEFPELLVAGSWEIQSKYVWPLASSGAPLAALASTNLFLGASTLTWKILA